MLQFGTLAYAAPEAVAAAAQADEFGGAQYVGLTADPSMDLWSFGALLYELCEGAPLIHLDEISQVAGESTAAALLANVYEDEDYVDGAPSVVFNYNADDIAVTNVLRKIFTLSALERASVSDICNEELFRPPSLVRQRYRIDRIVRRAESVIELGVDTLRGDCGVALKWLADEASWRRETEALKAMSGAHVAPSHIESFVDKDAARPRHRGARYAVVMERGEKTVTQLIKEAPYGSLPRTTIMRICKSVLEALRACKARGVVHTDVKPENVMLFADNTYRLIDFDGASKNGDLALQFGTLSYASPEMVVRNFRGTKKKV